MFTPSGEYIITNPFNVFLNDGTKNPGFINPFDFQQMYPNWLGIVLASMNADVQLFQSQKTAKYQCDLYNSNLVMIYNGAWTNWLAQWNAKTITDPKTAPKPPLSWIVIDVPSGPAQGAPLFGTPDQSGPPIMAMPVIPILPGPPAPNHIAIGKSLGNGYFALGLNDTYPIGKLTPMIIGMDGTKGIFQRLGSPFGASTGWYLLITKG